MSSRTPIINFSNCKILRKFDDLINHNRCMCLRICMYFLRKAIDLCIASYGNILPFEQKGRVFSDFPADDAVSGCLDVLFH